MRPRGESISSPHSRYVGQVGRQKPQCTQSATSCGSGPSDATDEPPRTHPAVRVELRLDAAHHGESTYGTPYVELGLDIGRCVDDHNRAVVLSDVAAYLIDHRGDFGRALLRPPSGVHDARPGVRRDP